LLAVVRELDALKKSENGARSAIRWLEREFKEGERTNSDKPSVSNF
jgi:hypothetical protein